MRRACIASGTRTSSSRRQLAAGGRPPVSGQPQGCSDDPSAAPSSLRRPSAVAWRCPSAPSAGAAGREQAAQQQEARRPAPEARDAQALPPESVTRHTLAASRAHALRFTATAGHLTLTDPQGAPQAEIGFVAYTRDDADPATRPVTFAVNGGPGASSAYLHLLAIGPWRLPLDGPAISPSASAGPRAQCRDLARFHRSRVHRSARHRLQPRGRRRSGARAVLFRPGRHRRPRGLRHALAEGEEPADARRNSSSARAMAASAGRCWRRSCRATRASASAASCSSRRCFDFDWLDQAAGAPWVNAARLPSLAAAKLSRRRAGVARSAAGGGGLCVRRVSRRSHARPSGQGRRSSASAGASAELTGSIPSSTRRLAGRIDMRTFQRELRRDSAQVVSAYDTERGELPIPNPTAQSSRFEDPVLDAHDGALDERDHRSPDPDPELQGGGALQPAQRLGQRRLALGRRAQRAGEPRGAASGPGPRRQAARARRPRLHRSGDALLRLPASPEPASRTRSPAARGARRFTRAATCSIRGRHRGRPSGPTCSGFSTKPCGHGPPIEASSPNKSGRFSKDDA